MRRYTFTKIKSSGFENGSYVVNLDHNCLQNFYIEAQNKKECGAKLKEYAVKHGLKGQRFLCKHEEKVYGYSCIMHDKVITL